MPTVTLGSVLITIHHLLVYSVTHAQSFKAMICSFNNIVDFKMMMPHLYFFPLFLNKNLYEIEK